MNVSEGDMNPSYRKLQLECPRDLSKLSHLNAEAPKAALLHEVLEGAFITHRLGILTISIMQRGTSRTTSMTHLAQNDVHLGTLVAVFL